jgi:Zn-dependent protease with chaperone function
LTQATVAVASDRPPLLSQLDLRIPPVRTGGMYSVALVAVSVLLVLLPLVYVGLIGGVGWAWWTHATNDVEQFSDVWIKILSLAYVGPLVIGLTLIVFMLKPLLAPKGRGAAPFRLDRDRYPTLHEFADRVARAVGAPAPREVRVDCQVNASASFRRGFASFFGNDLVLTIGLPLVAALDTRQLAAVLAHEFGHFSQGAAMRGNYIILTVLEWFRRVVQERDAWDEKLAAIAEKSGNVHLGAMLVLQTARFCVWLTRRILWCLMMVGYAASCWLCRQMEFDADRHAARLCGSEIQESIFRELRRLSFGEQVALHRLQTAHREGRLGDDFPALVLDGVHLLNRDDLEKSVDEVVRDRTIGIFSTHPSNADRIAMAMRESTPGLYSVEEPARVLVEDWAGLCREATRNLYRHNFGLNLDTIKIVPSQDIIDAKGRDAIERESIRRYFQSLWNYNFPLARSAGLSGDAEQGSEAGREELRSQLETSRHRCLESTKAAREAVAKMDKLDDSRYSGWHREFHAAFNPATSRKSALPVAGAKPDGFDMVRRPLEHARAPAVEAWGQRLALVRRCLGQPWLAESVRARVDEFDRLQRALDALADQMSTVRAQRPDLIALSVLMGYLEARPDDQGLIDQVLGRLSAIHERYGTALHKLNAVAYPLPGARPGLTLAGFLHPHDGLPRANDMTIARLAQEMESSVASLYTSILRALSTIAEAVESELGFEPFPMPPEEV